MTHALRITRAVLHALRRRISPTHSLQLISQFPMLMKAIYVDGWKITDDAKYLRHLGDFIEAVREEGGNGLRDEFTTDGEVKKVIEAVFSVLQHRVSAGAIDDIIATLPEELRPLLMAKAVF
jgi:uncharacterized protein (DUF2267 family)